MGGKQHAWMLAGFGWVIDQDTDEAYVMAATGERPILCLPPGLTVDATEKAFGWAASDLKQQRDGWLSLLRELVNLNERTAA